MTESLLIPCPVVSLTYPNVQQPSESYIQVAIQSRAKCFFLCKHNCDTGGNSSFKGRSPSGDTNRQNKYRNSGVLFWFQKMCANSNFLVSWSLIDLNSVMTNGQLLLISSLICTNPRSFPMKLISELCSWWFRSHFRGVPHPEVACHRWVISL